MLLAGEIVIGSYVSHTGLRFTSPSASLSTDRTFLVAVNGQQYVPLVQENFTFYELNVANTVLTPRSGPISGDTSVLIGQALGVTAANGKEARVKWRYPGKEACPSLLAAPITRGCFTFSLGLNRCCFGVRLCDCDAMGIRDISFDSIGGGGRSGANFWHLGD